MAVTPFQARVLKLLAANRIKEGEAYVAGGLALNHQLHRLKGTTETLAAALREDAVVFHPGRICGAWPQIVR